MSIFLEKVAGVCVGGGFVSSSLFLSNRCFSLKTVKGLRFDESLRKGEDQDYLIRALLRVEKGVFSSGISYRYRLRKSSLSHEGLPPVEDLCLYISLLKKLWEFPIEAQVAIEKRSRELWWSVIRESVEANLLERYTEQLRDAYEVFVSMKPVVPISFGFRKRLFCYRIGNWFIRLYLKQRARHQMECHDDELANAFD